MDVYLRSGILAGTTDALFLGREVTATLGNPRFSVWDGAPAGLVPEPLASAICGFHACQARLCPPVPVWFAHSLHTEDPDSGIS